MILRTKCEEDLTGKEFHHLTVIEKDNNFGTHRWLCRCDCGNLISVQPSRLLKGKKQSCGCHYYVWNNETQSRDPQMASIRRYYTQTKRSAVVRNIDWDLDFDVFKENIFQPCCYCGDLPEKSVNVYLPKDATVGNGRYTFDRLQATILTNGLDRINNNLGYVKNNIRPCCRWCNYAKSDMSEKDFLEWTSSIDDSKRDKNKSSSNIEQINLCGKLSHHIKVIEPKKLPEETESDWQCVCSCGRSIVCSYEDLINERIFSCGCQYNRKYIEQESLFRSFFGENRANAKYRDLNWNLSVEKFRSLVFDNCYYCGIKPFQKYKKNISLIHSGIDRIDSDLGYELDNVVSCCKICNRAKHARSQKDFMDWLVRLKEHQHS